MSPDDVMRRMVRERHGAKSEFLGNAATDWGTANEPGAVIEYERETGNKVTSCGFYKYEDWLGASPDGLIGTEGLIEVKCPYSMRKGEGRFKTAKEQMHYYAQMQIQMFVTKRAYCDFYQWSPAGSLLEHVPVDLDFINDALPKLKAFWFDCLSEDPARHLEPLRKELNASQIVAEYDDAVASIKLYEDRKKELLEKLVEIAGGKNASFGGRKLTYVERVGSVAYAKAVKEHLPTLDLEPYRGEPSAFWKLS
jgi:hypothetical protein